MVFMNSNNHLAQEVIVLLQTYIQELGFKPVVHFELEGCYQSSLKNQYSTNKQFSVKERKIDFKKINQKLEQLNLDGELVPEYWKNQWEYVSKFNGQTPLKEAKNLASAIIELPKLFAQQGISKTLIKPVVWSGDNGKLASGCDNIFSGDNRVVHIPNAVQINVSAIDINGENIIPKAGFGEYLQQCFIQTSLACCLLYLPEEEAFERLALKSRYGLADELCSPIDITGGHQGSIALYKKIGKHNQKMGLAALLYDKNNNVMLSEHNWQQTARIEHRLGASSLQYNAYINVVFALANLCEALEAYVKGKCIEKLTKIEDPISLPLSLFDKNNTFGAISLFEKDNWLSNKINDVQNKLLNNKVATSNKKALSFNEVKLGDSLKKTILSPYQCQNISLATSLTIKNSVFK